MGRDSLKALAYIRDNIKTYIKEIRFENMKYYQSHQHEDRSFAEFCEHEYEIAVLYNRLELSCLGEGILVVILQL
jgi:hypothetical protein